VNASLRFPLPPPVPKEFHFFRFPYRATLLVSKAVLSHCGFSFSSSEKGATSLLCGFPPPCLMRDPPRPFAPPGLFFLTLSLETSGFSLWFESLIGWFFIGAFRFSQHRFGIPDPEQGPPPLPCGDPTRHLLSRPTLSFPSHVASKVNPFIPPRFNIRTRRL